MIKRKPIDKVFTPRNSTVNTDMYIARMQLEKDLYRSVMGSMHSFLFGESGNGKSWLYKKVFSDRKINYVVANCSNASRRQSIVEEIYSVCVAPGKSIKTGYKETKTAGVSAIGKAELAHQGEYSILQNDKLLDAFKFLSKSAKGQKSVVVLDNVETIFQNDKLMSELSDIIILLDDETYASYRVKLLLVAVPIDVMSYFSSIKNAASVGNRVEECPRVRGLGKTQVQDFTKRGFNIHLKVKMTDIQNKRLADHIYKITLGVPQRVHEYCECLAYSIEDNNWVHEQPLNDKADQSWMIKGLRGCYAAIEGRLNSEETIDGRRNQVLYSIGKISTHQINTNQIGKIVRREFPSSAPESNSGIGQVLAFLAKGQNPILAKISNSQSYSLIDPRFLMCLRIMLVKDDSEQVRKKAFRLN